MLHTPQLILWCASAGAYLLLVAGPLDQGSIELEPEGREIAEFVTALKHQHQRVDQPVVVAGGDHALAA